MALSFNSRDYHEGFEFNCTIAEKALGHEVSARVVFDLGDVLEERRFTLKGSCFSSLEEATNEVIALTKKAIDEFKKQKGLG
jgi:hypothetical protein